MTSPTSHSSQVAGWLVIGDQRFRLAQVGPTSCVLRESISTSSCEATIIVEIDGKSTKRPVLLTENVVASSLVPFAHR